MALPVRPHPSAAPGTRRSRVLYDVAAANANSDPCLEFLPEERVFIIVPASSEPPRYVAHRQPQDVGLLRRFLRLLHPRTVLLALHRGVARTLLALYRVIVGTLLALHRGVVGIFLALYRAVAGALLGLYRGVVGALWALYRVIVGTLLALYRGVVGTLLAMYRGVMGALWTLHRSVLETLLALRRGVVRTCLSLYRSVVETLLALHRAVVRTCLSLYRGVVGTLLTLCRGVVGTLVALRRVVVGTLLALYHSVMGTLLALHHGVTGTLLALYRGTVGTLLALRRHVVETLSTLHRRVVRASVMARRTTSEVARWTRSFCAAVIEGTTSIGISGLSRFRRFCGDVRTRGHAIWRLCGVCTMLVRARLASDISTIERVISTGGRRLAVVTRSLHERRRISLRVLVRTAQKMAIAHQPPGMRLPLWAPKISRARVPVLNLTLAAVTGASAVGALVIWQFGMQPGLPRPTGNSAAPGPDVVASGTAIPGTATLYAVTSGTTPGERQGTKPSPVSVPMVVMTTAVTVMSSPAGARVTVDGIGWGETPVTIRHLPPGQKVVRVTKEGYKSQQRIVNLADAPRPAAVRITLRAHD